MFCAICQENEEDGELREWTTMPCGHSLHTQCALECAWKGHIACVICRKLPIAMEEEDIDMNRSNAIEGHNDREMARYIRNAHRLCNNGQACGKLKLAMRNYKSYKAKCAENQKKRAYARTIHKEMKADLNAAVKQVKDKYIQKAGKATVNQMFVHTSTRTYRFLRAQRDEKRAMLRMKRKLARAAGWRPIDD
jgi:hypothetical protein